MRTLEVDWVYAEHCDPTDTEPIAAIRSACRAAGRRLGWKVRTGQSDPRKRKDGKAVVLCATVVRD